MIKLIRTATVASSLDILLKGQLQFLSAHYSVVAISAGKDELLKVSEREGVPVFEVSMSRKISIFKDFYSLLRLVIFLKKSKPKIIHSITPKAGLLSMLAGRIAGVPIRMHTFTGLIFPSKTGVLQKILILMDKLLCWSATNIYPEGQGVLNDLRKFNITNKELKVLANGNVNGIDTSFFSKEQVSVQDATDLKNKLAISSDDFVFIFVGRLVGDKGINELVAAFKALSLTSNANKQIKLLLVGPLETDLDPLYSDTLTEINDNPNIVSAGFQKDVRPYFVISDALVFPSYREGFPNVVMQAGAMELPAVVSNINGCNEIIINNKNGMIIPVKDSKAVQNAMERLLENTDYYHSLKQNARRMITERYEQKVVWQALLAEYNQLLK